MLAAFMSVVAVAALVVGLVVPELVASVQLIFEELPRAFEKLVASIDRYDLLPEDIVSLLREFDWQKRVEQLVQMLSSGIGNVLGTVVNFVASIFSGLITALLSLIFSVYLLLGKDRLLCQFKRIMDHYLPEHVNRKIRYFVDVLNDCFHRYLVGQCTEAVILGMLCTLGMLALKLPYPTMVGALVAFTALIPIAGAYIGACVGAFMILTVSPVQSLMFIVFLIVLQQLEGNLIYPKVVGSSIGLPGIWVLAAVTIGGGVMGVPGMILGVPLTAAVYRVIREDMNKSQ